MSHFTSTVDKRSRKAMVDYLSGHFRYDTMGSWNHSTSYAHNVKLHRLGLTREQYDEASALIYADDDQWGFQCRQIIEDFTSEHSGGYTIGQNGRSGGYMVLYESHYKQSEHRSRCVSCGQRNFTLPLDLTGMSENEAKLTQFMVRQGQHWINQTVLAQPEVKAIVMPDEEKLAIINKLRRMDLKWLSLDNKCGVCHASGERGRKPFSTTELVVWPGRSIDMDADWDDKEEWSMSALRRRVELVQSFDAAVERMRDTLIDQIETFEVVEQVVQVPQKVTVTQPRRA